MKIGDKIICIEPCIMDMDKRHTTTVNKIYKVVNINHRSYFIIDDENDPKIRLYQYGFKVIIYTNNTLTTFVYEEEIIFNFFVFNKQEKELKRKIYAKNKEIEKYLQNKKAYEYVLNAYNLLPIKELRKNKLKEINENENNMENF